MGSADEIIELARRSGLPYQVGSTYRPGARTLSGRTSWHASDNAVDFTGYNQDALASYFMRLPTLEVIHYSDRTRTAYATSGGRPFQLTGALLQQHRGHLHVAANEAKARAALTGGGGPLAPVVGAATGAVGVLRDAVGRVFGAGADVLGGLVGTLRAMALEAAFAGLGLALLGAGVYRAIVGRRT